MRKQQRNAAAPAAMPLLKTCQTCFKAKIRCHSSQDSGSCDRCLRLAKACSFPQAQRRTAALLRGRNGQPDGNGSENSTPTGMTMTMTMNMGPGGTSGISSRSDGVPASSAASAASFRDEPQPTGEPALTLSSQHQYQAGVHAAAGSYDAVAVGLLDMDQAERLVHVFRSAMTPHFPFVVLHDAVTVEQLRRERPCLCLAVLAVSAFHGFALQRQLSALFSQAIAARLVASELASLDVLQGLLVHLAWAHYQPRPRSYSQHLHLATSIVSDLRLDRPPKPYLWGKVEADNRDEGVSAGAEWGPDEQRALIGTYYLASSSSIVLLKMRHFPYSPFILDSCEKLEARGEFPGDKYLKHIVQIQSLSEQVDDLVGPKAAGPFVHETMAKLVAIRQQLDVIKLDLHFALSECPLLLLQLGTIELSISQHSLPGSPFAPSGGIAPQQPGGNHMEIVNVFSDCVLAAKSLINILIAMPPRQETVLTNIEWISLSWALSFSVRLDLMAASPRVTCFTKPLRRTLDIRHALRQVVLRIKSMVSPDRDNTGDRDAFYHFLRRVEPIEAWYLRQAAELTPLALSDANATPPAGGDVAAQGMGGYSMAMEPGAELRDVGVDAADGGPYRPDDFSMMDLYSEGMVLGAEIWPPIPLDNF
ncbi:hypothetical protein B0T24DRAFT_549113 [Lasiosphaeria ovina]|uniref:Zn(2)-C6 fungal-type domain-containing protein n=1 Tax=Lasiosphaeria ovina TaxID=92902 RepID=A0AAE0KGZ4_9PEZI|nr:hypothetical protein B0T24DRAFT_549113 [Lasiosphaeria ovina]